MVQLVSRVSNTVSGQKAVHSVIDASTIGAHLCRGVDFGHRRRTIKAVSSRHAIPASGETSRAAYSCRPVTDQTTWISQNRSGGL